MVYLGVKIIVFFSWATREKKSSSFQSEKKKFIYTTELSFGSLTPYPKWHLVPHQTLSGSEIFLERAYVNSSSDKSVNVNAATKLGIR